MLLVLLASAAWAAPALHGYTWQSRVQVMEDGDLKSVQTFQVTPDASGHLVRQGLDEQDSPLPGVPSAMFESRGLVGKMEAYAALGTDGLAKFVASAGATDAPDNQPPGVRYHATSVLEPGDQVVLLVAKQGRHPLHMEVRTAYEAAAATLEIDYGLTGAVAWPSLLQASVPDHYLQVAVENSNFRRKP